MTTTELADGRVILHGADCRDVLRGIADNSIDSIVTDPPYALVSIVNRFGKPGSKPAKDVYGRGAAGFMGKTWDTGEVAFSEEFWAECLRVLKPGGHVVAFSGTRTYHRMAVAIEDAGFEIRDQLGWLYGSGFPKSHDVAKSIDKAARGVPHGGADPTSPNHGKFKGGCSEDNERGQGFGAGPGQFMAEAGVKSDREYVEEARAWQGWGTALKPAWEPICLARKPLDGTVAENVLKWGTGALNIDGTRVPNETEQQGRWPANIVHDGSDEVLAAFPDAKGQQGKVGPEHGEKASRGIYGDFGPRDDFPPRIEADKSAARFFYCAKASRADRDEGLGHMEQREAAAMQGNLTSGQRLAGNGAPIATPKRANIHPTVKPTNLMQWLCRLVTPPGGVVFDPFMGSGSTGKAAVWEGFRFIGCEREEEYMPIAEARIRYAVDNPPAAKTTRPSNGAPAAKAQAEDLFSTPEQPA